ncbi:MAG: carbohydrate ABC transporter permease [Lachnospirales bacterium]
MKGQGIFSKRKTKGDMIYDLIVFVVGIIIVCLFFFPLWYIFVASLSKPFYIANGDVLFWIKGFTTASYEKAFETANLGRGFINSIIILVGGTAVNMFFTTTLAYALSKRDLPFKKFFNFYTVFTMLFTAGMIPFYQVLKSYNLLDSYWGNMIGFAVNTFNVIILRSFFQQVSDEYEEAARIDGAGTFRIFWQIYLPLSGAALATISLFYAVSRWNGYFWSSILFTTETKQPLQVILRKLLVEQQGLMEGDMSTGPNAPYSKDTITYATIIISTLPMILVFPFIQKYFRTGVTLGGVKG